MEGKYVQYKIHNFCVAYENVLDKQYCRLYCEYELTRVCSQTLFLEFRKWARSYVTFPQQCFELAIGNLIWGANFQKVPLPPSQHKDLHCMTEN